MLRGGGGRIITGPGHPCVLRGPAAEQLALGSGRGGAPRDPLSLGVSQQKPFPVICSAVALPQLNLCGSCCLTCPQVWAKKTLVPP